MSLNNYIGPELNGYPNGEGIIIKNDSEIEGFWEKGKRVKQGLFKSDSMEIKCKYKNGKIYKFFDLRMKFDHDQDLQFQFNQPKYIQEGEFYREVKSDEKCFVLIKRNKCMFDGFPVKSNKIKVSNINQSLKIYEVIDDKTSIRELQNEMFTYVGRLFSLIPFGPGKIIRKERNYIKGFLRGYIFVDEVKIVKDNIRIFINGNEGIKPSNIRVLLKDRNIEVKLLIQGNFFTFADRNSQIKAIENKDLIKGSLAKSIIFYLRVTRMIYIYCKHNLNIANSLIVTKSWLELEKFIEKRLKDEKNIFKFDDFEQSNVSSNKENFQEKFDKNDCQFVRERYCDGSFYYGEFSHGVRHGLSCFVFANGDKYKGYFKMNNFSGQGMFKTSEYKLKGVWENNKLIRVSSYLIIT